MRIEVSSLSKARPWPGEELIDLVTVNMGVKGGQRQSRPQSLAGFQQHFLHASFQQAALQSFAKLVQQCLQSLTAPSL